MLMIACAENMTFVFLSENDTFSLSKVDNFVFCQNFI